MPIWIPIAVSAALFQCWRTAMQQKLRGLLSVNGAGFVRDLYGMSTAIAIIPPSAAETALSSAFAMAVRLPACCDTIERLVMIESIVWTDILWSQPNSASLRPSPARVV
jgi:hypothetical protein